MDIIAYLSVFAVAFFAYKKKAVKLNAVLPAIIMGIVLYLSGGFPFLTALYTFFIGCSVVSKLKKKEKEHISKKIKEKSSNRDYTQVLGSGLMPFIYALLYLFTKDNVFYALVFVSLAIANADTWASELGVLSKKDCFTIIPFKKCLKGISGGVSTLGLFTSFLGSLAIALVYYLFTFSLVSSLWIIFYGFIGSIVDSILGSTCQVLYYEKKTKRYSEIKEKGFERIKGLSFMTNEMVNFVSNLIVSGMYLLIHGGLL